MIRSWEDFESSIFSTMTKEARDFGAINLAQGFPDFDGPKEVIEEAIVSLRSGFNQYAPSQGYRDLRYAIKDFVQKRRALDFDPEREIGIFSGASEALFCAVMALCAKDDEILCFEPFFDTYKGLAFAARAKIRCVELKAPHWDFDRKDLEKAMSSKTKIILLNTPHNPTGKVFSKEELEFIAKLAQEYNCIVVSDDVYEDITFSQKEHLPMASISGMKERTISISSLSKTFSFTGWKIGYALAPEALLKVMRAVHEHTVFCSASPLQKAAIVAFESPEEYFLNLRMDFEKKKNLLKEVLENVGFKIYEPFGSYFFVADYSNLSEVDDLTFSLWLTRTVKVACLPLSSFYENSEQARQKKLVRFCFAKTYPTLMAAVKRFQDHYGFV